MMKHLYKEVEFNNKYNQKFEISKMILIRSINDLITDAKNENSNYTILIKDKEGREINLNDLQLVIESK